MRSTSAPAELWPWVALRMVPGVGVGLYHELLRRVGAPAVICGMSCAALTAAGVPAAIAAAIASGAHRRDAERDVAAAIAARVRIVTWADPGYPEPLRHVADPPPYLYVRGQPDAAAMAAVAVVGSRAASRYGREVATRLAREIAAAGVTVVSGLAHGVDGAAHRGALASGGRTMAVLGSGIDVIYPAEHRELAAQLETRGALISEFFMGTGPRPSHFPVRNRIIAGLSRAVVVVEATERSGSLITARLGLEQGREVFAVPGPIDAARSRGTHRLIRDGARLITAASDVLEELGLVGALTPCVAPSEAPCAAAELAVDAASLVAALSDGPLGVDGLVAETGLTPQDVLRILLQLELSGTVRQLPGVVFGLCGREKRPPD